MKPMQNHPLIATLAIPLLIVLAVGLLILSLPATHIIESLLELEE